MQNQINYPLLQQEHLLPSPRTILTKSRFFITALSHPTDSILDTHLRQNAIFGILGQLGGHFSVWRSENIKKLLTHSC